MLPPPVPYTVRPAEVHESGAIAALIAACDRAVDALPSYIESDLLDDWRRHDFVLDRDTWVVESPDDEIVGYAEIACEGPKTLASFGAVHPRHRRRGLGSHLIDLIEKRAFVHPTRTGADTSLLNIILRGDHAAHSLVTSRGYVIERAFQHMEIDLRELSSGAHPGVEIRPFDPVGDREALHALMESAFEQHWDYSPTPFEKWWDQVAGGEDYDPSLWWWASIDGETAGALLGNIRDEKGWVTDLGVLKRWRGRGVGAALLRHSFAEFKRRGFEKAGLNVDSENETGAARLYERVGMQVVSEFDFYKKVLGNKESAIHPEVGRASERG
jgi:mycothiol synthase